MSSAEHDARIRDAFTKQAATFEDADLNVAFTAGIPWIVAAAAPRPSDRCLEVAAGTALISRALAPRVSYVVGVDLTPAMLQTGTEQADRAHLDNLGLVLGDARELPFPSDAFDLVVTRFSLHHFEDVDAPLAEMVRVCRPGGRLVVMDLVASTDPAVARAQDHVERLRDGSHVRMPPADAVSRWLEDSGVTVTAVDRRLVDRGLEQWLTQGVTDSARAAEVRTLLTGDIAGGPTTGLRPSEREDGLWFQQTWELTCATK